MQELRTKGVEELDKVIKRTSRLYGMGRINPDQFNKLNQKLQEVRAVMLETHEIDPGGAQFNDSAL